MTAPLFESLDRWAASVGFGAFVRETSINATTQLFKWEHGAVTLRVSPRYLREHSESEQENSK
jgi:hypothetical protein